MGKMKMPISGTFRVFINWLVLILIIHFLIKHLLLHNNFKKNELDKREEFNNYCNKLLTSNAEGYIDTSSTTMKSELQKYIDDKNLFSDNKNDTDTSNKNELNGFDKMYNEQNIPDFKQEKTNLNNFFDTKPIDNQCYKNTDPKINLKSKENMLNTDFNKPDMWLYDNENIMNGGNINDSLLAYDNLNDSYALFDDNNIVSKC